MEVKYEGHSDTHLSLQKHSIGEHYPLVISYMGNPNETNEPGTGWYVWHALTGVKTGLRFRKAADAGEYASDILEGKYPRTYARVFRQPHPYNKPTLAKQEALVADGAAVGHTLYSLLYGGRA